MVLDRFIYFSMYLYVVIVTVTREERTENQTGGAIVVTIHMLRAMSVPIFAAVLLSIPVWADADYRSVVTPIQGDQPVPLHEDQRHGAQLTPTHRGGLSADSLKAGDLNLKNLGGGMESSRTIVNSHASFNSIRPEEFQEHDARGSGIPLWRW